MCPVSLGKLHTIGIVKQDQPKSKPNPERQTSNPAALYQTFGVHDGISEYQRAWGLSILQLSYLQHMWSLLGLLNSVHVSFLGCHFIVLSSTVSWDHHYRLGFTLFFALALSIFAGIMALPHTYCPYKVSRTLLQASVTLSILHLS